MNYGTLLHAFWNSLITMTTVGYGDIFPRTHAGRTIAIIEGFVGNFVTSLFVVSFNNLLSFDATEKKAQGLLQRLVRRA